MFRKGYQSLSKYRQSTHESLQRLVHEPAISSITSRFISSQHLPQKPPHDDMLWDELPFKAVWRPSLYIVLLHLVPVMAVVVITSFNLYGYWIGKELSGLVNNENAPKALALQLTAKLHELLMLASLSEVLLTHLLKNLAFGYGLPFASLVAINKFQSLSYIWSKEFWAMCAIAYPRRSLLVPLLLVCTMLGVAMGPSSATALIPRLDVWPAGGAAMTLNTTSDMLWPSVLHATAPDTPVCDPSGLGCSNPLVWNSFAANMFSYWGHVTTGGATFLPNYINVPSVSSARSMEILIKNSAGPALPIFTIASVQHAVVADMVNSFRFLTFPSQSRKCKKTWSSAMCSYQDVSWFVEAKQPVVFAACSVRNSSSSLLEFPVIDLTATSLGTMSVPVNDSFADQSAPQFHWINLNGTQSMGASIGVIVKPGIEGYNDDFVCTVRAQWAQASVSASYTSYYYTTNSEVPGINYATLVAPDFKGEQVVIDSSWAQQAVESLADSPRNVTAFRQFMQLGSNTFDPTAKLETALSVLFAETMAHVGSGTVALNISSRDLHLKTHGDLVDNETLATVGMNRKDFNLQTSMTGYGYGMYTMSGLSSSTLIAIVILYLYSTVAILHLVSLYTTKYPYIESWREDGGMLRTCLESKYRAEPRNTTNDQSEGNREKTLLNNIVVLAAKDSRVELSFRRRDWLQEAT